MRALNRVELIGRLGGDPEVRYTQSGDPVASLSIATNETWTDKATGQPREETEWHRCVLWRRLAEIAEQYLGKGSRCYVAGKLRTRKWQDQSGQDRFTTEIEVRDLILLDGRAEGAPTAATGPERQRHVQRPAQAASFQAQAPDDGGFDDDIPF